MISRVIEYGPQRQKLADWVAVVRAGIPRKEAV